MIRVQEHHPEVIVYDIQGDLALADGAVDEGHDDVVGAVQEERSLEREESVRIP